MYGAGCPFLQHAGKDTNPLKACNFKQYYTNMRQNKFYNQMAIDEPCSIGEYWSGGRDT